MQAENENKNILNKVIEDAHEIEKLKSELENIQGRVDKYCGNSECKCYDCGSYDIVPSQHIRVLSPSDYEFFDTWTCNSCGEYRNRSN